MAMADAVRDNPERSRFELDVEGQVAFANYRRDGGVYDIVHTEVPHELNGKGYGSDLVRGTLTLIRSRGQKMRPMCGFVRFFLREHPEYADLVA
jgi:predicted GNAT family acetyltransferase